MEAAGGLGFRGGVDDGGADGIDDGGADGTDDRGADGIDGGGADWVDEGGADVVDGVEIERGGCWVGFVELRPVES